MNTSTRWLVVLAGTIAATVVVGLAVTVLAGGEQTYPEGSPERAVQDYLHAVINRDATAATSFLAPELAARCDPFYRDAFTHRSRASTRATLDRATTAATTAEVHVRITETYGDGPFNNGESTQTVVFMLSNTSGEWRFTESPWPLYCPPTPVR